MKMSKYVKPILKALLCIVILTVIALPVFAQQVNQDELKDLPPVVFINYEGPHARVDTREEIRQLGVVLGRDIPERERGIAPTLAAMNQEQKRAYSYKFELGPANRYFVIHCVSGSETDKLDADVFGLGVDTGVDHVRNLRVILQGYLQEAYQYNASDALLLAEYITVYNAVYRGNWDYYQSRYKSQVISNMTREKAGLSIRYDEWPGRTLMAIPLGAGGLGAIDTSAISDSRVVEEMRKESDQSIPQRQAMVELKEREAEQADRQARVTRQETRQEEARIVEEKKETAQERVRVQEEKEAGTITEQEARKVEEKIVEKERELEQREEKNEQLKEVAESQERLAEKKSDEAQQERQLIAKDQQLAIAQEDGGVLGITIDKTNPTLMGKIVRLDPANGNVTRRSPLDLVHVRTVTFVGGRLLAIAGENKGQGAVRLIEINQTNLEMAKQGDDDIRTGSLLWVNGSDLYAITTEGNNCFLGRFNANLEMQAKSSVRIHPDASVTIQQGRLLTQRPDGTALVLNPADLTEAK
jgi:hypothetical protein